MGATRDRCGGQKKARVHLVIKSGINRVAVSLCWEIGRYIALIRQDSSVLTVCEYPKAGGTWIAKSIATATDLPYVGSGYFLPLIPSVIRTHWAPSKRLSPCIFVVRDVRDVMVSLFHHRCKNMHRTPKRNKQFLAYFGEKLEPGKIREQLPGFVEIEFSDPRYGAHMNWGQHSAAVVSILDASESSNVALLHYEDMLDNPAAALSAVFESLSIDVPDGYLSLAIELNDRKWGGKNYTKSTLESTFLRSGTSGSWRKDFSVDTGKKISELCGKELIALGYEQDMDWWKDLPASSDTE